MKKLLILFALLCMAAAGMAQVTFTGVASNNRFEGRAGHNELLDGNLGTKWEAWASGLVGSKRAFFANEGNVVFRASEAIYVNGVILTTGNDTKEHPNRNPYYWHLYGSNNDAVVSGETADADKFTHDSWVEIACVNNAQMPLLNKTAKSYKFNPSQTAYKYFKFHVEHLVGDDELQLAELALDYTTTALSPISVIANGTGHYGSETADKIFDGTSTTKWCKSNNVSTNWVVFSTTKPICASSYTIQNSNDAEGRDPNKFKLYGASGSSAPTTDGNTDGWTLIDTEDNAKSVLSTDHYAYAHFTMDNPGIYKFFMLKVEETRSASDGNFQMSEFVLDEYDQFADEYVQISNDTEMASFASQVNSGNTTLKAVLLADVNSSTSIGTESNKFAGEIDGMGHKVNLNINASSNHQGFVGYATGGATIKNLILTGSVKNTANKTGGFIAEVKGGGTITITNCGNEAKIEGAGGETAAIVANNWGGSCTLNITNVYNIGEVSGTGDVASICAYCGSGSSVFLNVYNSGTVTGDSGGKFVRYSSGTYTNCYCVGKTSSDKGDVIDASAADVTSGKLCYKLNGSVDNGTTWTQTIGTDTHPVLFFAGQPVRHASTDCATNLNVSGGNVQLGSTSDMIKFAAEVAAGNTAMNGSVTANIDMSAGGYSPIGTTASKYAGTFDGQGHIVTLNISSDQEYQGLIGCATGGAEIKNVITRGSVSGSARCGGILGGSQGSGAISITNCGNEADITTTGKNAGGVHGCNNGSGVTYTLINCYNTGTIKGSEENAGLSAWLGKNATVTNCYNIGSVSNNDVEATTFTRFDSNNPVTYSNCFNSLSQSGTNLTGSYSMDKVRSGELCYQLNGTNDGTTWTQTIGTDSHPIPFSTRQTVHQANTSCFTNLPVSASNVVQIDSADDLKQFAAEVNAGNSAMNAELTGVINMSGVAYTPVGTDTYKYAGTFNGNGNTISNLFIDQSSTSETGMFSVTDGATIQNIVFDNASVTGANNTGIVVGKITNGSFVKDIVIKNSEVTSDKQNTGGVVGNASASTIQTCAVIDTDVTGHDHVGAFTGNAEEYSTIQNNLSNSDIESTTYQVAGIVGVLKDATVTGNLFTGAVIGGTNDDAGGLASRIDGADYHVTISKNMIAASSVTGPSVASIVRDWHLTNVTFEDNYLLDKTTYNGATQTYTNKDDKNGKQISWIEATTKDFYETTLGWDFTNTWKFTCGGKYPILKIMADEALPTQDVTVTSAGYATMVANYDYDFTSAPVETYAVTTSATPGYVHLEPVTSAKHGEALLLKGSADTYTLTATATAKDVTAENLLKAADEDVVSYGTKYALAKINDIVGFYQVGTSESSVTIPAGKAYLDGVPSSVKAYIFDFDDDDDPTSLSSISSPEGKECIYNLAGQRINKMQKGINIINGKKILK